ncbi:metal-dependent hydrolase [Candidatus Peregrinibacteria bacterium]|nr:MAG: metal-dependent hydrolase [Candidatus Peregrinibacteria bacterium]
MFIAHLPAGYILTKKLQKTSGVAKYLWVGLLGSILPDIDMLYFYLVDNKQHLHHDYWIHTPFYWMLISLFTFLALRLLKKQKYYLVSLIFFANIFLHLFLDTLVGKINWLYPFSSKSFSFFEVPAIYDYWVYNFVFHWTFLIEVFVIVCAVLLFHQNRSSSVRSSLLDSTTKNNP